MLGVPLDRGSLSEPILGRCLWLEKLYVPAGVVADKFKELERLKPVLPLGQHHCHPDPPRDADFGGVIRQPIQLGQRYFGQGVRIIDEDAGCPVMRYQIEGFDGLRAGILVAYFTRGGDHHPTSLRSVFNCPRHITFLLCSPPRPRAGAVI